MFRPSHPGCSGSPAFTQSFPLFGGLGAQRFAIAFEEIATNTFTDGFDTWNDGDIVLSTGPCYVDGF